MTGSRTIEPDRHFMQKRRWLKTRFVMTPGHLDYGVESRHESERQKTIAWDTIGARLSWFRSVEPDRELHWICIVLTLLAGAATLRGGPQPLTFALCFGVTLVLIAGALLTRRLRCVGYTAIPAAGLDILVLDDSQHDTIVTAIEARRRQALLKAAEPAPGLSIRAFLRRLRWLAENDVLTRDEFAARQAAMLPGERAPLLPPEPAWTAPQRIVQRRLGTQIGVELQADRLIYRRSCVFGGSENFCVPYVGLAEASVFHETDRQYRLALVLFGWFGIGVYAWMAAIAQAHPGNYYVGGVGLGRALADFGPALLAMAAGAAIVPRLTQLKTARPWPSLLLLRDARYDGLVAEIERRRIGALRALAEPDPLLEVGEQMQVLDELREAGAISDEDYPRLAERARAVCDNPALDLPAADVEAQPRERALH